MKKKDKVLILKDCIRVPEVADILGVTQQSVRNLISAGELPAARFGVGRGVWRILRHDLDEFIHTRQKLGGMHLKRHEPKEDAKAALA